jgi:hypothetical protein
MAAMTLSILGGVYTDSVI